MKNSMLIFVIGCATVTMTSMSMNTPDQRWKRIEEQQRQDAARRTKQQAYRARMDQEIRRRLAAREAVQRAASQRVQQDANSAAIMSRYYQVSDKPVPQNIILRLSPGARTFAIQHNQRLSREQQGK